MTLPIETVPPDPAPTPPESSAFPPAFRQLMVNSLVSGVTSTFLWFALTFWVYLETRSVVTTGVIAGTFSLVAAVVGPLIGTFVDHHRKHTSLLLTSAVAATSFGVATATFYGHGTAGLLQLDNPWFWLLVARHSPGRLPAPHALSSWRPASRSWSRPVTATGPTVWSAP